MDETTITVIGMIVAFITASVTAFLAEPVKIYFQNKAKLRNLKVALYQEMIGNNHSLAMANEESHDPKFFLSMLKSAIRTECYKHIIANDPLLFYQLHEAETINIINGGSVRVLNAVNNYDTEFTELDSVLALCEGCTENFSSVAYKGFLDKDILKSFMQKEEYRDLLEAGKKESEKDDSE